MKGAISAVGEKIKKKLRAFLDTFQKINRKITRDSLVIFLCFLLTIYYQEMILLEDVVIFQNCLSSGDMK